MSLLSLFEAARLTITAYRDSDRHDEIASFEAQYNPDTLSMTYAAHLDTPTPASGSTAPHWRHNDPARMNVTLVLDGTNVGLMGVQLLGRVPSVKDRVTSFLECCTKVDADSHEVPFLRLSWSSKIAWS